MERTFVMVKPDGVHRAFVGQVITRFETKGLKLVGLKMLKIPKEMAEEHYGEHVGKPFYEKLLSYITSGPVVAMVLEGKDAVNQSRRLIGATDPKKAEPGTIRGDFGLELGRNIVHGSDSTASAKREIAIFFREEELVDHRRLDEEWLYED